MPICGIIIYTSYASEKRGGANVDNRKIAQDEYDDRYNIFQSTLTESKWHQIPGNLEIFLNGKTWITFSSSSSKKVQQAYERANWVEIASIPTEFDAIKNYLIWQNVEEEVLPF